MKSAVKYAFAASVLASGSGVLAHENLEPDLSDELALVRRVPLDQHSLDVNGGIRRWDADLEIAIETVFFDDVIVTGDEWVDPIIGAGICTLCRPNGA